MIRKGFIAVLTLGAIATLGVYLKSFVSETKFALHGSDWDAFGVVHDGSLSVTVMWKDAFKLRSQNPANEPEDIYRKWDCAFVFFHEPP